MGSEQLRSMSEGEESSYMIDEIKVNEFQQENSLNTIADKTKIMTEFRIVGDFFSPEDITKELEIIPTMVKHRVEPVRKTGRKCLYSEWQYNTGYEEIMDIRIHLETIYQMFNPKVKKLCELKKKYHLDFVLGIVPVIENGAVPDIVFPPEFLRFVSEIGMSFDIDLYVN